MLLKSCCGILRWQLKFHNHSWLHHCFYILLGLVWYLFCKHHPCLLGLVTVWTSFWVLTFCSKALLICIFCVLLHPCPAAWVPPLPHCIPQGTLAGEKLWGPWAPQAGAVTGTPPLPTRTCQLVPMASAHSWIPQGHPSIGLNRGAIAIAAKGWKGFPDRKEPIAQRDGVTWERANRGKRWSEDED